MSQLPYKSSDAGHYCRLLPPGTGYPDLEDKSAIAQFATMLGKLVERMNHDGPPNQAPAFECAEAGYTYFGQLIDHDLTQDVSYVQTAWMLEPELIKNFSSAKLDLDNIYGEAPGAGNDRYDYLYEEDKLHLKVGAATNTGPSFDVPVGLTEPPVTGNPPSLPVPSTPPQPPEKLWPMVADPRSAENLILRQMIALFARLHNVAVDELRHEKSSREEHFKLARRKTQWTYQWLLVTDYLPTILDKEVCEAVFKNNDRKFEWETFSVPVEFAVGAMRFGHSMVRGHYRMNFEFPRDVELQDLILRSVQPGPLEEEWRIDWGFYFQGAGTADSSLTHQPIDTQITKALHHIHDCVIKKFRNEPAAGPALGPSPSSFKPASLPHLSLMRGAGLRLASGQAAARACGVEPLTEQQLTQDEKGKPTEQGIYLRQPGHEWLLSDTPLWYYILKESEVHHSGNKLGKTGSRIVAETIHGALKHDLDSILNQSSDCSAPPTWRLQAGDVQFHTLRKLFAHAHRLAAR